MLTPKDQFRPTEELASVRARAAFLKWAAQCEPSTAIHPSDHVWLLDTVTEALAEAASFEYEDETIFELLRKYLESTDPHGDLARPINLEGYRFHAEAVVKFLRWAFAPVATADESSIPQLGEAAAAETVRAIGEDVARRYGPEEETGADPKRVLGRVLDDLAGAEHGDS